MVKASALSLVLLISACDVFQGASGRPRTELTEREFIEVFVALGKARSVDEKAQILKQRGTSEKELQDFMQAYVKNLPALSAVFDSIVARQGAGSEGSMDVPRLPR